MPRYKIHRIKDSNKEHFRWSPHTGGVAVVKPKDYHLGGEWESDSPYALWKELRHSAPPAELCPLSPGDVLETVEEHSSALCIFKYIGFEPAQWYVPEVKSSVPTSFQSEEEASHDAATRS